MRYSHIINVFFFSSIIVTVACCRRRLFRVRIASEENKMTIYNTWKMEMNIYTIIHIYLYVKHKMCDDVNDTRKVLAACAVERQHDSRSVCVCVCLCVRWNARSCVYACENTLRWPVNLLKFSLSAFPYSNFDSYSHVSNVMQWK